MFIKPFKYLNYLLPTYMTKNKYIYRYNMIQLKLLYSDYNEHYTIVPSHYKLNCQNKENLFILIETTKNELYGVYTSVKNGINCYPLKMFQRTYLSMTNQINKLYINDKYACIIFIKLNKKPTNYEGEIFKVKQKYSYKALRKHSSGVIYMGNNEFIFYGFKWIHLQLPIMYNEKYYNFDPTDTDHDYHLNDPALRVKNVEIHQIMLN